MTLFGPRTSSKLWMLKRHAMDVWPFNGQDVLIIRIGALIAEGKLSPRQATEYFRYVRWCKSRDEEPLEPMEYFVEKIS